MENKIKYLRALKDMTQEDLANLTGCTRQTINAIEKNKYSPSLDLGFKIADKLETDITEVFIYKQDN
jgi:putative transcriptional regulator